jgi:hypothetical protein
VMEERGSISLLPEAVETGCAFPLREHDAPYGVAAHPQMSDLLLLGGCSLWRTSENAVTARFAELSY